MPPVSSNNSTMKPSKCLWPHLADRDEEGGDNYDQMVSRFEAMMRPKWGPKPAGLGVSAPWRLPLVSSRRHLASSGRSLTANAEVIPMKLGESCMNRVSSCDTSISRPRASSRCSTSWRTAPRRKSHRRQRRHPRHLPVHGRRNHAEPRGRAKRGPWLRAQGWIAEGEFGAAVDDASAAALHAGADHADGADRGVQPASFGRPATVPVAAAEPRPPGGERAGNDAGTDRQHAGRAPEGVTRQPETCRRPD